MNKRFVFTPFVAGFLALAIIYVMERYSGVSSSVAYVLTVLLTLWSSWNNKYVTWVGVVATTFIVAGFLVVEHSTALAIAINRVLSIFMIWLAIIFANRYRKLSEKEAVQKRQLQALFENATEGMIFTNFHGEIVRVNPTAEKMFGYDRDELLGKKIEVLIPDSHRKGHIAEREKLVRHPVTKPKGAGREFLARHKSGTAFYSEVSLSYFLERKQVYYIAFIVDISDRKKQEQVIEANVENIKRLNTALDAKVKLRTAELETVNSDLLREISERKRVESRLMKSQQLYMAIARNFPEGVIGVLDRNFRYILAEGQELNEIGIHAGGAAGRRLFSDEHEPLIRHAEGLIRHVFDGESVSFDIDLKSQTYNLLSVPLPDVKGEINEVLVVMKNITAAKLAQRKLIRAVEKERELSSLKSRFVTMASHEFRTPLSTMLSSVFLLENYKGEQFELQKRTHLERIRRSIQTLTELMNDFLSIGSLEEGQIKAVFSPLEIGPFLSDAVTELSAIKKSGQHITLDISGGEATILTDRQMLTNILRNLVSNAVKYSPSEGRITVMCALEKGELKIQVQDEGIGIPEHEQSEIFKRFYRAENVTNIQGTGLGLNIVRKYLKLLNGTIAFESRIDEGTTFTVRIPVNIQQQKSEVELIP